jgi:hypothetical protein
MENLIEELKREGIIKYNRERADWMYWLTDQTQRFLSFGPTQVELWQCIPGYINQRMGFLPIDQANAVTVACLISGEVAAMRER